MQYSDIEIKFDEAKIREAMSHSVETLVANDVQILRVGTFHHPQMGEVNISRGMLASMVINYKGNIRGVDLAIDYKHDSEDVAAGWIKDLRLSEDGEELWAMVSWTPQGLQKLSDKEFRYLSADFHMNYKDNESLKEFGPTLFGAGLTNRPVVKRMEPVVQLSERKENKMSESENKLKTLETENKKLSEENASLGEDLKKFEELPQTPEEMMAMISGLKAEVEKLKGERDNLMKASQLSEKEKEFDKLLSDGKAVPAQKESYIEGDLIKFAGLSGNVKLSEEGKSSTETKTESAHDKVMKLAEDKVSKDKCTLGEAISFVLSENKELAKDFN